MSTDEGKRVAAAWDRNAELWAREVRAGCDSAHDLLNRPQFFEFIPAVKDHDVLDLGCGEGRNTREMARLGARVTGVDISPRMLGLARDEERRAPLGIRYEQASATELATFAAASFDLVLSAMALMDTPDFPAVARTAFRVLRPGGGFYFSVIHPCFATRGSRWVRDEAGEALGRLVGNYFDEDPYVERWGFKSAPTFEIVYFPYRIADYINGLCAAGFRITSMREPRPSAELAAAHTEFRAQRLHTPFFLHLGATKAGA